jgi:hypothetical protein
MKFRRQVISALVAVDIERHIHCLLLTYCRTCDVSQRLGKGTKRVPAPSQSLPLVTEPFSQVAIDITGPLPPCKNT